MGTERSGRAEGEKKGHLAALLSAYPALESCRRPILAAFERLESCYRAGGKLLVCGNGGSAADSEHIVGELMKGFLLPRPLPAPLQERLRASGSPEGALLAGTLQGALPALSLTGSTALSTAFANDAAPELVFAQQVVGHGRPGDLLLGLSTSGNSRNVVLAVETARAMGLGTIGLTGAGGGRLGELCEICIRVPADSTPAIQELHLPVYHTLCAMLEEAFFG